MSFRPCRNPDNVHGIDWDVTHPNALFFPAEFFFWQSQKGSFGSAKFFGAEPKKLARFLQIGTSLSWTFNEKGRMFELQPYQYAPAKQMIQFLLNPLGPKGVLVYYEVGTGKTLAALHAAAVYRQFMSDRGVPNANVVVVTTAANVVNTWEKERSAYLKHSNLKTFLRKEPGVRQHNDDFFLEIHTFDYFARDDTREARSLLINDQTLLIVDEVHRLRNAGEQDDAARYAAFHTLCSNAKYVIALTATPLYDKVQHLVAIRNLFGGGGGFSEDHLPKNPNTDKFAAYIQDLILYQPTDKSEYATQHDHPMDVVMDDLDAIIDKGRTNKYTKTDKQILNYLAKQNANPIFKQIVQDHYHLKQSFLVRTRQLNNTPSKIQSIWDKIIADQADGKHRVVVFSHFLGAGRDRFLATKPKGIKKQSVYVLEASKDQENQKKIKRYNSRLTSELAILVLTPAFTEGLSLKNVRTCHIIEPSMTVQEDDQIIGRCIRRGSHNALPPDQRQVDVYYWMSTFPKDGVKVDIQTSIKTMTFPAPTTDKYLFNEMVLAKRNVVVPFSLKLQQWGEANVAKLVSQAIDFGNYSLPHCPR